MKRIFIIFAIVFFAMAGSLQAKSLKDEVQKPKTKLEEFTARTGVALVRGFEKNQHYTWKIQYFNHSGSKGVYKRFSWKKRIWNNNRSQKKKVITIERIHPILITMRSIH